MCYSFPNHNTEKITGILFRLLLTNFTLKTLISLSDIVVNVGEHVGYI